MSNLLNALINASERAANIARSCIEGSQGGSTLLVSEKTGEEANSRFEHDFKTIADVLAQEAAKTEISRLFPSLSANVRGEECGEINGVRVSLKDSPEETAKVLGSLVPEPTAQRMAVAAHYVPSLPVCDDLPKDFPTIDEELGVWIDPIDATSEFISGVKGEAQDGHGLPCVTVLIGAYLQSTGEPIAGVINQPFYNGKGRIIWGICYKNMKQWGGYPAEMVSASKIVLISSSEKASVIDSFKSSGWEVKSCPGAGYKLLKVALGEASAYAVSAGTTYPWDTCGPHAVLRARGGDVCSGLRRGLDYRAAGCHREDIVAVNDEALLDSVLDILAGE